MEQVLGNQLLQVAQKVEEQLDSEINKLDSMNDDDIEKLRENRLKAMRKAQAQKQVINFVFVYQSIYLV